MKDLENLNVFEVDQKLMEFCAVDEDVLNRIDWSLEKKKQKLRKIKKRRGSIRR